MDYAKRRKKLHQMLGETSQPLLFWGNHYQPRNYAANLQLSFRQNSHFLYYFGTALPNFVGVSFADGRSILFGPDADIDTIIWEGKGVSLAQHAKDAQVNEHFSRTDLKAYLSDNREKWQYLPPYQAEVVLEMCSFLGKSPQVLKENASSSMIEAVVEQRLVKEEKELEEIEDALSVTGDIFRSFLEQSKPGVHESVLFASFVQQLAAKGRDIAFPPIITTQGQILHSHGDYREMQDGSLLLIDMGTESGLGYASDITRTIPVNGRFSSKQRAVYEIVLTAQQSAIEMIKPGISYAKIHLEACKVIVEGLCGLGLMKGDPREAVDMGAHALFFPHGLGHAMGLDVHDMEDLGDTVGYGLEKKRSEQFGLNFLRFAKPLEEGYVMTVEPGIYFIPALMDLWQKEEKHTDFICYDLLNDYRDFGGIRIEDDVLVTVDGFRILGEAIPKSVVAIETLMQ